MAVLRKKILMQVRDQRTLSIDVFFPILLIFAGLALSTISFIKNSPLRVMTPFLYDENNISMYWNSNSGIVSDS